MDDVVLLAAADVGRGQPFGRDGDIDGNRQKREVMTMSLTTDIWFRRAWGVLARRGACDEAYSQEYERVYREWYAAGCPTPVRQFIRRQANITATGDELVADQGDELVNDQGDELVGGGA